MSDLGDVAALAGAVGTAAVALGKAELAVVSGERARHAHWRGRIIARPRCRSAESPSDDADNHLNLAPGPSNAERPSIGGGRRPEALPEMHPEAARRCEPNLTGDLLDGSGSLFKQNLRRSNPLGQQPLMRRAARGVSKHAMVLANTEVRGRRQAPDRPCLSNSFREFDEGRDKPLGIDVGRDGLLTPTKAAIPWSGCYQRCQTRR
jgi:hypothetical protein